MILIKPAAQEGTPHCLSSKVPSPHSHFPLCPSHSVISHLNTRPSPRPGLLQDIPLSSALASPPAGKESAEGSCVPRGDFPGIMNTPGSCSGAQKSSGLISKPAFPFGEEAVLLDLAWSFASDLGLCTCLFLVPFVGFGFWAGFFSFFALSGVSLPVFNCCQLQKCLLSLSTKLFKWTSVAVFPWTIMNVYIVSADYTEKWLSQGSEGFVKPVYFFN